ncbi:MAG: amidohydrolase family protein [Myxococcota bacterium]
MAIEAGEVGGAPLVLLAAKVLVAAPYDSGQPQWYDHAALVIQDGRITAVGEARNLTLPEDAAVVDLGDQWIVPGMIDLHSHVAAPSLRDLSDSVYLANPGMRRGPTIAIGNRNLQNGVGGGITAILSIPGSATNMGGQGILLRLGLPGFEESVLRDPGSLKLAQAGNPERYSILRPRRTLMNYNTRSVFRKGRAYAQAWKEHEEAGGPRPERVLMLDIFRDLFAGKTQVSTHTQMYQVVLMTLTMVREEFGLDVYIDHGTFDGYRAAEKAAELEVPAILGPRMVSSSFPGANDQDGAVYGIAAQYQKAGHKQVGFNTDTIGRGMEQGELSVQAAMGCRYGFDNDDMAAVRGVTIVPAQAAGLGERIGSLEVGKAADLIVTTGDPLDPRESVEMVFVLGRRVYDTATEHRRF